MSGAGGGSTRFAPNTFQYNGRIAAALLPCLAVAALLGGQPVLAIFSVGAMLAYIMDALTYREGALAAAWATLGLSGIVLAIKVVASAVGRSPAVLATLLPASAALLTATGLWATLQFRWIQMRYPAVALASERLLLGGCLPLAAIFHSVGAALALDISSVPFVTAASCVLCYHWLARPLVSSFYQVKGFTSMGGSVPPHLLVLNKADGAILAFVTLCLPFILFIAIHSTSIGGWLNCWSVLLLVSAPASYLLVAPDGLWFVPGPPAVQKWLRRVALPPMLAMLVIALEGRVVFHAFSSYIKLSPPWSWLVVTGVLGCIAAGVAAAATGALETPAAATLLGVCFMVATAAGGLAAGIPPQWLPAPLAAGAGLMLYLDSSNPAEFLLFVSGSLITGAWFVRHNYGFLDIALAGLPLAALCNVILISWLPAMLLPVLVRAQVHRSYIGGLMLLQATLLGLVEERLHTGATTDDEDGGDAALMYPGYLVLATSALGLLLVRRLLAAGQLVPHMAWAVAAMHASKASMLLLPEALLVQPVQILALAVSAPAFIYRPDVPKPVAAPPLPPAGGRRGPRFRIPPAQGIAHVASVVAAVLLARLAIFDVLQLFQGGRPTESMLIGVLVFAAGAGCLPLAAYCYGHRPAALRACVAAGVLGGLLVAVQPPMPLALGAECQRSAVALCAGLWDARHVPLRDSDDAAVWGVGAGRMRDWPRWLLVGAGVAGMAGTSGFGGGLAAGTAKLAAALAAGGALGEYLALEVAPAQAPLQVLLVIMSLLVLAFIALLRMTGDKRPGGYSPAALLPLLLLAWAVCAVTTLLLQALLPLPVLGGSRRLFPDSAERVAAARSAATRTALLAVTAGQALLMAFALKLKIAAALRNREAARRAGAITDGHDDPAAAVTTLDARAPRAAAGRSVFLTYCRALGRDSSVAAVVDAMAVQGLGWAPTLCNLAVLAAFAAGLAVNASLTGAPEAVFMLAPVLLMLSQDPLICWGVSSRQRYAPPVLAVAGYLVLSSSITVTGMTADSDTLLLALKNWLLLAAAAPMHSLFVGYLWTQRWGSSGLVLALVPFNALALLLTDVEAVWYLAAASLLQAAVLYAAMRASRGAAARAAAGSGSDDTHWQ